MAVQFATIIADTTGGNNYYDSDFYGISFDQGLPDSYIQSVTLDLRAGSDTNAFFDFPGGNSPFGPVLSTLNGLNASDVTFTPNTGISPTLTLNFAPNSFGVGDSLRFGADTDWLSGGFGISSESGGAFGAQDVSFTVTLQDGTSFLSTFDTVSSTQSIAEISTHESIVGTSGNDQLNGTSANEFIQGLGGDDTINSNGGEDVLFGNAGNDTIAGSHESDYIDGGAGNDLLYGNGGGDTIFGRGGDDGLYGSSATDYLNGGNGDDTLYGNGGRDTLIGGRGDDLIYGGSCPDYILGGEGDDIIYANGANNGADYIDSGVGQDTIWLGHGDADVVLSEGVGFDVINNFQLGQTSLIVSDVSALSFADGANGAEIYQGSDLLATVSWQSASTFANNTNDIFVAVAA
ncbi:type I secretion target GGXGXDXXX repeat protein domain protein [Coleofasciculus chthonoplastes PCC 7420]|uniref:Type I secretion target GGXGXDXXX repeat protein domain protein n=1 Tax=Coleofasciculus chthonoplastes PCC 7420 TaxID=118168 RepID=B4VUR9_9CYAN|nr:calcium-binding protein [Coleofasciculus chthonoplastes]EDX74478.1 type I secretion target GGXGXDXXX repeat protein domain protein [Coleofasciculus chthonoplastes PCC 7420]